MKNRGALSWREERGLCTAPGPPLHTKKNNRNKKSASSIKKGLKSCKHLFTLYITDPHPCRNLLAPGIRTAQSGFWLVSPQSHPTAPRGRPQSIPLGRSRDGAGVALSLLWLLPLHSEPLPGPVLGQEQTPPDPCAWRTHLYPCSALLMGWAMFQTHARAECKVLPLWSPFPQGCRLPGCTSPCTFLLVHLQLAPQQRNDAH